MKKKNIAGLIAIVAIVVVAMFAGCIEEGEAPESTPTPTATPTPEITESPTPTPTPTSTPLPEPKYVPGDIIAKKPTNKDCLWTVISYDEATDEYEINYIFHNRDGTWGHFANEDTRWWERDYVEESHPTLIDHVDLSTVTIDEPKVSLTPTPTSKPKKWHSVTTFSGSNDKTTNWFTIKGDEWRVTYTARGDPDWGGFYTFVYHRGETAGFVAKWDCMTSIPCSGTQYIYEGNGDYYFKVGAANLDSWKLEVEDYY